MPCPGLRGLAVAGLLLLSPSLIAQAPAFSELMARNATGLRDSNGDYSDWFEITNPGSTTVNLAGWYASDDAANLTKWKFPSVTIGSGGFLVVFASGKNRTSGQLHTNFNLSGKGEFLALVRPDGRTVASSFSPRFPEQRTDYSYGIERGSSRFVFFQAPTPGKANGTGVLGFVGKPTIHGDRGHYSRPFAVTITTPTPQATIRYTTDGSVPTPTHGSTYLAPITIPTTTCLRAAAFLTGLGPSLVETKSYLFVDDVIKQPNNPPGFPRQWGSAPAADYEMDPEIVNHASYRSTITTALKAIPSLSLVMNRNDMFGSSGIYSNPTRSGRSWERFVSAELIPTDSAAGFQIDAGIRIQGGASRNPRSAPKHSLSLRFRDAYGTSELAYPIFAGSRVRKFDALHLRAMYNNSWIHWSGSQRPRGSLIRDQWARDALIDMGQEDGGQGSYVHLYVDGLYWGVYNLHERQEAAHYAAWHGGSEDDYDALNGGQVVDGNLQSWTALRAIVQTRHWPNIQKALDVDNYIDFWVAQHFAGNRDLKTNGNWRAAGGGRAAGPWRLYAWDTERILESPTQTGVGPTPDPPNFFSTLDDIQEFVVRVGDRLHAHLFNDGALTAKETAARWMRRARELDLAIIAESARWGDYRRDVHRYSGGPFELYHRNRHWIPEQQRLIRTYFPVRTANVLQQFRGRRLYPSVAAPAFNQHGGGVPPGFAVTMTAPSGPIYYTVDGTDPRLEGGKLSGVAIRYQAAVKIFTNTTIKARVLQGTQWSALNAARFQVDNVTINELLARNVSGIRDNAGEREDWLELYNKAKVPVDVGGFFLTDDPARPRKWQIPAKQVLAPGATLLVWCDEDLHQGPLHANFKLSAAGEEVWLYDVDGRTELSRMTFGPQQADISTGPFDDGGARMVTFLDPTPSRPNAISPCGARRYSALDSTSQPTGLALLGNPGLGQVVRFQISGGPARAPHVFWLAAAPDELALPFSSSKLLLGSPFFLFGAAVTNGQGSAFLDLTVPRIAGLPGVRVTLQAWGIQGSRISGGNGLEIKFCP